LNDGAETVRSFEGLDAIFPDKSYVYENGRLTETSERRLRHLDGKCPYVWRQGVKHDAGKMVEVELRNGAYYNRLNRRVEVENDCLFPLVKSSDVFHGRPIRRCLIMPFVYSDGEWKFFLLPSVERYFTDYRDFFLARKSKIYAKSSVFSYFGVGEYSFKPYKIAVSGFHKSPRFRMLRPVGDKPRHDRRCVLFFVFRRPFRSGIRL
jgi:hypothetical protein